MGAEFFYFANCFEANLFLVFFFFQLIDFFFLGFSGKLVSFSGVAKNPIRFKGANTFVIVILVV